MTGTYVMNPLGSLLFTMLIVFVIGLAVGSFFKSKSKNPKNNKWTWED